MSKRDPIGNAWRARPFHFDPSVVEWRDEAIFADLASHTFMRTNWSLPRGLDGDRLVVSTEEWGRRNTFDVVVGDENWLLLPTEIVQTYLRLQLECVYVLDAYKPSRWPSGNLPVFLHDRALYAGIAWQRINDRDRAGDEYAYPESMRILGVRGNDLVVDLSDVSAALVGNELTENFSVRDAGEFAVLFDWLSDAGLIDMDV